MNDKEKIENWDEIVDHSKTKKYLTTNELLENFKNASKEVTADSIWNQYSNRFCVPSYDGVKEIIKLEWDIADTLTSERNLIRPSELIPLWAIHFLTWTSQNRSISTSRNLDTCGDLSVALALEAINQRKQNRSKGVYRYAAFDTTLRPQKFYPDWAWKHLKTHFAIYWNVIAWKENKEYYATKKYMTEIILHYIKILDNLQMSWKYDFSELDINISDLYLTSKLLEKFWRWNLEDSLYQYRSEQIRMRSQESKELSLDTYIGVNIDEFHDDKKSFIGEYAKYFNDKDPGYLLSIFEHVQKEVEKKNFSVNPRIKIWYGRAWGSGQYQRLCFNISAKTQSWSKMFFSDWGTTGRGNKLLNDSSEQCVIWGMWTELLANYFRKK